MSKRRELKRTALLKVASEMFLANGYEGVSVDAVVEGAGGTKTNIYTIFGGKAQLFEAVVVQLCGAPLDGLTDLSGTSPADVLREFGREYLAAAGGKHAIRLRRLVIAEATRFPALGKLWLKSRPDVARANVAAYLVGQGISDAEARKLAGYFLGLLDIELQRQLVGGSKALSRREIDARVNDAVAFVLQGTKLDRRR